MACLTDDCKEIDGNFPRCFEGIAAWYLDVSAVTQVILKWEKGGGSFAQYEGSTLVSGLIETVFPIDVDSEFFTQQGGWYTMRAYAYDDLEPIGITDNNGHGQAYDCIRFCVGPETTSAVWSYNVPPPSS